MWAGLRNPAADLQRVHSKGNRHGAQRNGAESDTDLVKTGTNSLYFSITVSKDGTELYIFYTRKTQEYKIYYPEYGTDISDLKSLTISSKGALDISGPRTAKFGTTVTVTAEKAYSGMTCVSALTQSILIQSNDDQSYIIFYYAPVQRTIEYRVWAYGGGTLDITIEVFNGETAAIKGSTPTALNGYAFGGWYLDADCTVPADGRGKIDEATNHPDPYSEQLTVMPEVNVFYVKFIPINGSLTITRQNGEADESSGTQVFVYKIQSKNDPSYVIYVTTAGNGSATVKDLPCREYTVEQQNDWSWRYEDNVQDVSEKTGGTDVFFDTDASRNHWLSGNSKRITNQKITNRRG